MKKLAPILLLLFFSCTVRKSSPGADPLQAHAEAVKASYAPDARTALFSVTARNGVVAGETNIPEAKEALLRRLREAGQTFIDSITVLPHPALKGRHFAVVNLSVANLRTLPRHPAELSTQAMLGTPLKVWKFERGWYLVQTPDQYLAWMDGGGLELMDSTSFYKWHQKRKIVYTQPFGFAYTAAARDSATVSDLVYGDVLEFKREQSGFYEVGFPDGRTAFVPATDAAPYRDWATSRQPTEENLVSTARRLMGLPYLWGGTSVKGVDCSGFTKTIYFMNGLVLPRDASQQVTIGEEIDTKNGWQNLRPGDLLFFGAPAREGRPERVVHVGMWIGNGEFIHSAGRVQVGSLIPGTANYDESEHKRFLRAKRIDSTTAIHDLRKNLIYETNGVW
ncbi:MAG TPA: C40 family peptidase [Flavisolibacter sp.]